MDRRNFLRFASVAGAVGIVSCWTPVDMRTRAAVSSGLRLHIDATAYLGSDPADRLPVSCVANVADTVSSSQLCQPKSEFAPLFVADSRHVPSFDFAPRTSLAGFAVGNAAGDCTAMVVFTPHDLTAAGTILTLNGAAGPVQIRTNPAGALTVRLPSEQELDSSLRLQVGEPVVLATTFDASGNVQFFCNGSSFGGYSLAEPPLDDADIVIGAFDGYDATRGAYAEVLVWDRAFDGYELREMFDALGPKWAIEIDPVISAPARVPFAHQRFKGSNIHPKKVDIHGPAWRNLWVGWDWTWISRSVDSAIAQSANSIRIIGDVEGVFLGMITKEQYIQRLRQLAEYCRLKNCGLYYCMMDLRHIGIAPVEFVEGFVYDIGVELAQIPNLIAIDVCNEVASVYGTIGKERTVEWITRFAERLRQAAPSISLSLSEVKAASFFDKLGARSEYETFAPIVDVMDIHIYSPPHVSGRTNAMAAYELIMDRPLIFGEIGANIDLTDPVGAYRNIAGLCRSSDAITGVLQWASVNDGFGLYSETTNELRAGVAKEWSELTVGKPN